MEARLKEEVCAYRIGHLIKKTRRERKITQEALGRSLGVQRAQISRLEGGSSIITLPTLRRAFKALGVAFATLDLGEVGKIQLW